MQDPTVKWKVTVEGRLGFRRVTKQLSSVIFYSETTVYKLFPWERCTLLTAQKLVLMVLLYL